MFVAFTQHYEQLNIKNHIDVKAAEGVAVSPGGSEIDNRSVGKFNPEIGFSNYFRFALGSRAY